MTTNFAVGSLLLFINLQQHLFVLRLHHHIMIYVNDNHSDGHPDVPCIVSPGEMYVQLWHSITVYD